MSKSFKFFVACCGVSLAALFATSEIQATDDPSTGTGSTVIIGGKGGFCSGKGTCGITKNGTILVGKWVEP